VAIERMKKTDEEGLLRGLREWMRSGCREDEGNG
jgi:hypothetical protein